MAVAVFALKQLLGPVFVLRAGAFDRERHEVPFVLVQLVRGQVDRLCARSVAQLQRDRSGRVHVSQAFRGSVRVLSDVRQESATAVGRLRHLMMIQLELRY